MLFSNGSWTFLSLGLTSFIPATFILLSSLCKPSTSKALTTSSSPKQKTAPGGRMIPKSFGAPRKQVVIELGSNWVQGMQKGNGIANSVWELVLNDLHGSLNACHACQFVLGGVDDVVATYNDHGFNNYPDVLDDSANNSGVRRCIPSRPAAIGHLSLKSAYDLMGITPKTPQQVASDYYRIDSVKTGCFNVLNSVDPAFDPFRFVDMGKEDGEGGKHQFVPTSPEFLPFRDGRHACPGRFFAGAELKTALAHIVMTYDVKLEENTIRPRGMPFERPLGANPTARVTFRKRAHCGVTQAR